MSQNRLGVLGFLSFGIGVPLVQVIDKTRLALKLAVVVLLFVLPLFSIFLTHLS